MTYPVPRHASSGRSLGDTERRVTLVVIIGSTVAAGLTAAAGLLVALGLL